MQLDSFVTEGEAWEKLSGSGSGQKRSSRRILSPLFEIALVLVRFDHVASRIVNADHRIM